jgi:putative membrane protein
MFTQWHYWHLEIYIGLSLLLWSYWAALYPLRPTEVWLTRHLRRKVICFFAGFFILLIAEISPIHDLSKHFFSIHMLQHVLLCFIVVPLLLLSIPPWIPDRLAYIKPFLPFARVLFHPVVTFFCFNVTFAVWHFSFFYDAAIQSSFIHGFEHLSMLAASVLGWWPILSPSQLLPRLSPPSQMLYLFLMPIAQIAVFAPVTFATNPFYSSYADTALFLGITHLQDQQIGGAIMKISTTAVFLFMLISIFFRWYNQDQATQKDSKSNHE